MFPDVISGDIFIYRLDIIRYLIQKNQSGLLTFKFPALIFAEVKPKTIQNMKKTSNHKHSIFLGSRLSRTLAIVAMIVFFIIMIDCSSTNKNSAKAAPKPAPVPKPKAEVAVEAAPTKGELIDLGLSVKWASCNVGAKAPEDFGGYFGWADPTGKEIDQDVTDSNDKWTSSLYGGKKPLKEISGSKFDIARVNIGGDWRMPTRKEEQELIDKCTWKIISYRGVKGAMVTGKNGNSIFLPMSGWRCGPDVGVQNEVGLYWSGTHCTENPGFAYRIHFELDGCPDLSMSIRCFGFSVRAVQ
jgi:hypothetical protein